MKMHVFTPVLLILSIGVLTVGGANAQSRGVAAHRASQGKQAMPHAHMLDMGNEPHHVLAMAYHHNLAIFADALRDLTAKATSVDVNFARPASAEMRRSFDLMKQHHQECMQTMSAEQHAMMKDAMEQMETHHTELNNQMTALDREVQLAAPDAKKVSALAVSITSHLDAMSKMIPGGKEGRMKMKM